MYTALPGTDNMFTFSTRLAYSQPPKNGPKEDRIGVSCPDCYKPMVIYNTREAGASHEPSGCPTVCQCGNWALADDVKSAHGYDDRMWTHGEGNIG